MADNAFSLPVRTETNGDVVAQLVDGTILTQKLAIDAAGRIIAKMADTAGTGITSQLSGVQQALDVGINVGGVQVDPRAIRALTSADVVTAAQGAPNSVGNAWPIELTDGTNVTAVKPASTAALATDPSAVVALSPNSPLPAGANALGSVLANMQVASAPVSGSNPVPVILAPGVSGTQITDYNTVSSLAFNTPSNHDYAITAGKIFNGDMFYGSSSGKLKIEVQVSDAAGSVFTSKFVGFNSVSDPQISINMNEVFLKSPISVTGKIRIIRTNLDKASNDVYSTIVGTEV